MPWRRWTKSYIIVSLSAAVQHIFHSACCSLWGIIPQPWIFSSRQGNMGLQGFRVAICFRLLVFFLKILRIFLLLSIFGRPVLDVKYKARQHSTLSMWNVIYLFNSDNCTRFLTGCFWHLYYLPLTLLGYNILYRQCKFIICYIFIVPAAKI